MVVLGLVVAAVAAFSFVGCNNEKSNGPKCSVNKEHECEESSYCEVTRDGEEGHCLNYPVSPQIKFELPFPAGAQMYCAQGSLNKDMTASHAVRSNNKTCQFALDFASPANEPPAQVLASAAGAAYVYGGCTTKNTLGIEYDDCNNGFGNMVKIDHGNGHYSLYAHLSAIAVKNATYVRMGDVIGLEGNTGMAGGKHIHWSLHKGDASEKSVSDSLPLSSILARDVSAGDGIALEKTWRDLVCGNRVFDGAHRYESRIQANKNIDPTYGLDVDQK